ncbi:ABC transporter substrate-binding protein [Rathayibacter sp. YIM 133350]|uniref:ABC transporter substrate-binding protein n=1 Tax=Rathayibacter sp. YIM 133350 TaxID=3131992 RepID=UPI00307CFB0E
MFGSGKGRRSRIALAVGVVAVGASVALAGCSSGSPLDTGGDGKTSAGADGSTLVVGSQSYYSNEIIAEIYAQALEANGFEVKRSFNIGQREAYVPSIENGDIDVFPEYTGDLLQFYDKDTTARSEDDVYSALTKALPDGLRALDAADASDQNSYVVTKKFATDNDLKSLADLAKVSTPLTLGGNAELKTRPYGPDGLKSTYDVTVGFAEIDDSGGSTTVDALSSNQIQLANVYTADPNIKKNDLVALDDPKNLFLASHVVPIVSKKVNEKAVGVINSVQGALSASDLVDLNDQSVNGQKQPDAIAKAWLADKKLF